ncbi:hypothetical protein FTX61_08080 [Nitriliruptoraceae bacterium ZYF776]|nr:hypothetical protein [Profundirhabdus halotolerans]
MLPPASPVDLARHGTRVAPGGRTVRGPSAPRPGRRAPRRHERRGRRGAAGDRDARPPAWGQTPMLRPMISFMISLVPP